MPSGTVTLGDSGPVVGAQGALGPHGPADWAGWAGQTLGSRYKRTTFKNYHMNKPINTADFRLWLGGAVGGSSWVRPGRRFSPRSGVTEEPTMNTQTLGATPGCFCLPFSRSPKSINKNCLKSRFRPNYNIWGLLFGHWKPREKSSFCGPSPPAPGFRCCHVRAFSPLSPGAATSHSETKASLPVAVDTLFTRGGPLNTMGGSGAYPGAVGSSRAACGFPQTSLPTAAHG